jgi:hypothetical protein
VVIGKSEVVIARRLCDEAISRMANVEIASSGKNALLAMTSEW